MDSLTGEIRFVSHSKRVKTPEDLFQLEENEKAAERARHGALGGSLRQAFYSLGDTERVDVEVHLRSPAVSTLDPEIHTFAELQENERAIQAVKPLGSIGAILKKFSGGLKDPVILDSSTFRCRMSKAQIEALRYDKHIDAISHATDPVPAAYAFHSLATSAYNPASSLPTSFRGQGVNAATFESGIANNWQGNDGNWYYPQGNLVSCQMLTPSRLDQRQPIWSNWQHSQQTFKALWQTAPYANLFHQNIGPLGHYGYSTIETFILNNSIQSASMSYGRPIFSPPCPVTLKVPTAIPAENARGWVMARMDEWAYRFPYPIFSSPAANTGSAYEVNWQSYNALSVGNVRHIALQGYGSTIS